MGGVKGRVALLRNHLGLYRICRCESEQGWGWKEVEGEGEGRRDAGTPGWKAPASHDTATISPTFTGGPPLPLQGKPLQPYARTRNCEMGCSLFVERRAKRERRKGQRYASVGTNNNNPVSHFKREPHLYAIERCTHKMQKKNPPQKYIYKYKDELV